MSDNRWPMCPLESPDYDERCRVYPSALLPDARQGQRGKWTIVITFEPEDA